MTITIGSRISIPPHPDPLPAGRGDLKAALLPLSNVDVTIHERSFGLGFTQKLRMVLNELLEMSVLCNGQSRWEFYVTAAPTREPLLV